ncbi:hypothetical protein EJK17_07875 [Lactobacillus xujianguonis]|uniref:XkdX family protein n=1 Tax=Lactobacillus xujianguonis TaxID=2495899 RepID=A0A437SU49_9LACO|nr:hypothetical protein [Lactobacillus xujianguonis]RVU70420.1 hypothetical protein EJK17_07875 [Lactobacillus xujianguonis]
MLENLFLQIWIMDFEFGLVGKDYFKGLVKDNDLTPAGYKKVTGDEYVAEDAEAQSSQSAQQA